MADVSIANLPAFVGNAIATDLLVMVDVADTSESPQGTTKRMTVGQLALNTITGDLIVSGNAIIGPDPGGTQRLRVGGVIHSLGMVVTADSAELSGLAVFNNNAAGYGPISKGGGSNSAHFLAQFQDVNGVVGFTINGDRSVRVDTNAADVPSFTIFNSNAISQGLLVNGGGISGRMIAQFQNYNTIIKFVVDDPAGQAGATSILIFSQDTGALTRVRTGPANSGPGGTGRALYIV